MKNSEEVKNHFSKVALDYDNWKRKNGYYYSLLKSFYKKQIPSGASVLEFGCATGDILSVCNPGRGVGIDISEEMIKLAQSKYPQCEFKAGDVEEAVSIGNFEFVIMCDLLEHVSDISKVIENAYGALAPKGRLVCTTINPLWNPVMTIAEKLSLKMPEGPHAFIPNRFIEMICLIKGFEIVSKGALIFIPKRLPLISDALNKIIPGIHFLNRFCWVQSLIAEKTGRPKTALSCSVIIPAYNEEGNIKECVSRLSRLRGNIEIIAVNDGSQDNTLPILQGLEKEMADLRVINFTENKGKASAVQAGIKAARAEAIVLFDADMAVEPEYVPLFIEALESGVGEFVNGTRLIYDMEKNAMSQIKRIGNFIFALIFSRVFDFKLTDTLCGTKSFLKKDFDGIEFSGEKWGDFILLEHAKRKGLRVIEIPVRYRSRKAGESKMRPFYDGFKFIKYLFKILLRR